MSLNDELTYGAVIRPAMMTDISVGLYVFKARE